MEKLNMKKITHQLSMWMLAVLLITAASCNDDDDGDIIDDDDDTDTLDTGDTTFNGQETSYSLNAVGNSTATGMVTFEEMEDGKVRVEFDVQGLEDGPYPVYIHHNNAADPEDVAITLESIDGTTGMSETVVSQTDDGSAFDYEDVADFDGFINVLQSEEDSTVILQADIGQNELTGETTSYVLDSTSESGLHGSVVFHQRQNDEVLSEINLAGTADDKNSYPASIYTNTTLDEGETSFTLNNVEQGMSSTNISTQDEGGFAYSDLENYNGNVRVGQVEEEDTTTIAHADIGQNALSGNSTTYDISAVDNSGISGTATYSERLNGQTRVDVNLTGDNIQGNHPVSIYSGSLDEPGNEFATLNSVNEYGTSASNVYEDINGNVVTYDDMIAEPGYIQVNQDDTQAGMNTVIAEGNVGASATTE